MSARAALLVALAAACGAGRTATTTTTSAPRRSGARADLPALRALLARYSPVGRQIVEAYEQLPRKFVFGDTTTTVGQSGGFADYFHDDTPETMVEDMSTAVHEVYHGYASIMGYQLLALAHAASPAQAEAVFVGGQPVLVTMTATYPAREMDATYPVDARTSRYRTYVSPSQDGQSTQVEGVYGLLDEMTAYYHSARTLVDFWPWVRDEAPVAPQLLVNYIARLHEMWVPYAELKLFILHYLRHARTHHPDVYRALVGNEGFRRGFRACDEAYGKLLVDAARLEATVHAFARGRGLNVRLDGGQLTFDGAPFRIRDAAYPAVIRYLASPAYREILDELR